MPYAKRTIMPGFPKDFQFETREQVDAYFSGDRITCLLCGRDFKGLEPHLSKVHQISCDEYREKYALPYKRGLVSSVSSEQRSENTKRMFHENTERQLAALAKAKAVQAEFGNPQRKKPKFWKAERTKYELSDYEEFLRRVVQDGRTASDVRNDADMPHTTNVYWFMKRNKAFADKYRALMPIFAPSGLSKADKEKKNPAARAGVAGS